MTAALPAGADDGPAALGVEELRGFRIGVTSDRRADDLGTALRRRGAQVLHAPALRTAPHDLDQALVQETRAVIAARPDVVLVTTGYGMRRWLEVADAAGLGAELTAVLDRASVLARGPKAVGAVRAAGLEDAGPGESDTTAALVDRVLRDALPGARVVVQQHGHPDQEQLDRLRAAGADVLTVTPYRWVRPASGERLDRLVEAVCTGGLEAITFTSAPAVDEVLRTAGRLGRRDAFLAALRPGVGESAVLAAVVGPVTARPLLAAGVTPVHPERYRLGALVRLVTDQLQQRVVRLAAGEVRLELRGRLVELEDGLVPLRRSVPLGPHALSLFRRLAATDGVVSRAELIGCLGDVPDDHALEVALSRLRRSLGVPDLIGTVVRRGYRLNASRVTG